MSTSDKSKNTTGFDPVAKEQQRRSESEQWDTSKPEFAKPGDIPTIDFEAYFTTGLDEDLTVAAEQLRVVCEETGSESRYSVPFFFNANPHHVMSCIPSCCSDDNPAKYPSISYAQSQGVVQGE